MLPQGGSPEHHPAGAGAVVLVCLEDPGGRMRVDVFVVEGNDARGAAALLAPTHFLAACIGPMDLVLVRRGSAPATRWRLLGAGTGAPAPDAALDERCPQFAAELAPLGRALDYHD